LFSQKETVFANTVLFHYLPYNTVHYNNKNFFNYFKKKPPLRELNGGFRSKKYKSSITKTEFVNQKIFFCTGCTDGGGYHHYQIYFYTLHSSCI
jgi:hypothetical protein